MLKLVGKQDIYMVYNISPKTVWEANSNYSGEAQQIASDPSDQG